MILNTVQFLVDMLATFIAKDFHDIIYHYRLHILELVFQGISFYYIIQYLNGDDLVVQTLFHLNVLRTIRLMELLAEMKHMRLLFSSLQAMTGPFISACISLYIVFFIYVQIGMLIFGGKINIYSTAIDDSVPGLYYLLNFNSFGAGMITMFHIMIVNNWFVTTKMYTNVFDSTLPRIFFISFWAIVVLIVLNIVVSIVLDIYDSVYDEVEEFFKFTALT